MKTYSVTTVEFLDFEGLEVSYGGKTYDGFKRIESGVFMGGYRGMAEGEEVIFLKSEVQTAVEEV